MSRYLLSTLALALLATACQGGSRTPLSPAGSAGTATPPPVIPGSMIALTGDAGGMEVYNEAGWLHTLTITAPQNGNLQASLEPLRTAEAKGDAYQLDGTGFFTNSPCKDCLEVTGISFAPDGDVLVRIAMTHPFALPTQPYTLASRLDLHAFDVMGFILTEGFGSPVSFGSGRTAAREVLVNAEGYTNLYDSVLEPYYPTPNVTEHPYRVFFRDDGPGNFAGSNQNGFADLRNPQGHNTMAMGERDEVEFKFDLQPGQTELRVGLAIGLAWGQGAQGRGSNIGQRQQPIYYLPEFHHKAPWTVTATLSNNNLEAGDPSSNATLEIRLRDWQRGAVVANGFAFAETPPDQTAAASDVASLTVRVPGLLATPLNLDPATPQSGTGLYDDAVWTTLITNQLSTGAGTYWAWVEAVDQRQPTPTSGLNREISFFQPTDFHTGTLVMVEVEDTSVPNTPPTAALNPNPAIGAIGKPVLFDASASTDAETPANLTFEFDYDLPGGDPGNFVPDTPASGVSTGSFQYCPVGSYAAAVRVTDPGGLSSIAVVPVTITSFLPEPEVSVLSANAFSQQSLNNGNFSGDYRMAIAGNHAYALVYDNATPSESDYAHRLYVSADGGATWTAGAVIDQSYSPPDTPSVNPWGDMYVVASPDGTVYAMGQQPRPDFGNTRLSVWTSGNYGQDPWVERFVDSVGQKYSLTGAVDPNNPAHVILSYSTGTCNFKTVQTSSGALALGAGPMLPGLCDGGFGASLFFAPNNKVYHCSVRFGTGSDGALWIRRSDDNGASWSPVNHYFHNTGIGISTVFAYGRGMADPTDATGMTLAYAARFNNNSSIGVCLFTSTTGGQTTTFQTNLDSGSAYVQYPGVRYYPTGELMLYWTASGGASNTLRGRTSCDNGATFSPEEAIGPVGFPRAYVVPFPGTQDFGALYQTSADGGAINFRRF